MRHSFQSRSLFHEARLLRFDGSDTPESQVPPVDAGKEDPSAMLDEFNKLKREGIDGKEATDEKAEALDAQVKQLESQCREVLKQMRDRAQSNPKWNELHKKYFAEFQDTTEKGGARIAALNEKMGRLQVEFRAQDVYDQAKFLADQIRDNADETEARANLDKLNGMLTAMPEGERAQWLAKYKLDREGTTVNGVDGSDFKFTQNPDGTLQYVRGTFRAAEAPAAGKPEAAPAAKREAEVPKAQSKGAERAKESPDGNFFDVDASKMTAEQQEGIRLSQDVNAAVKSGDRAAVEKALTAFNHYAADMPEDQRREMLDAGRLSYYYKGSEQVTDGRAVRNAKGEVYRFYITNPKTGEVGYGYSKEELPAAGKQDVEILDPKAGPKPVELDPAGRPELTKEEARDMVATFKENLPKMLEQAGAMFDAMKDMLPKIGALADKHADTIADVMASGVQPADIEKVFANPDPVATDTAIAELANEKGWGEDLEANVRTLVADVRSLMTDGGMKPAAGEAVPADVPVTPGEGPDGDQATLVPAEGKEGGAGGKKPFDILNKKVEMSEQEKARIVADGKKIIEEFKKIEKPTKYQIDQTRGQLMMAGVDATAGPEAMAKNPDSIAAKEGTAFQIGLNRFMGLVTYVMSLIQEMKDQIKGKKAEEEKKADEVPARSKEAIQADITAVTDSLKSRVDAFDPNDAQSKRELADLNARTQEYVAAHGGEPDISRQTTDAVGTLTSMEGDRYELSYDPTSRTYSFVPEGGSAPVAAEQPAAVPNDGAAAKDKPVDSPAGKPDEAPKTKLEGLNARRAEVAKELEGIESKAVKDATDEELAKVPGLRAELKDIDAQIKSEQEAAKPEPSPEPDATTAPEANPAAPTDVPAPPEAKAAPEPDVPSPVQAPKDEAAK